MLEAEPELEEKHISAESIDLSQTAQIWLGIPFTAIYLGLETTEWQSLKEKNTASP